MKKKLLTLTLTSVASQQTLANCDLEGINRWSSESSSQYAQKVVHLCQEDFLFSLNNTKYITDDYVNHYDKAILLGTGNLDYIEGQKKSLFYNVLKNIDKNCEEINLDQCIESVICFSESDFNLQKDLIERCRL